MARAAKLILPLAFLVAASTPAHATQGMICEGKGGSIHMLFGHAAVPALIQAELVIDDKVVPSAIARSWSGDTVTWLDLADPDQMALIASIRLTYAKQNWSGTLKYQGRKIAVRCEEA